MDPNNRPFSSILREVTRSFKEVLRAETRLAIVETRFTFLNMKRHSTSLLIFGGIAMLSLFPLGACLVIGLGRLLGDNYWLSSLIIGLLMLVIGGGLAVLQFRKIRDQDLTLPLLRESMKNQHSVVRQQIGETAKIARRRAA